MIRRWETYGHAGCCCAFASFALAARHGAPGRGAGLTPGDTPRQAADQQAPPADQEPKPRRGRPVVAVDAMGGDYAPDEIVAGAVTAAPQHGGHIVLAARPRPLRPLLARPHPPG